MYIFPSCFVFEYFVATRGRPYSSICEEASVSTRHDEQRNNLDLLERLPLFIAACIRRLHNPKDLVF